jgi:hypothetical protein
MSVDFSTRDRLEAKPLDVLSGKVGIIGKSTFLSPVVGSTENRTPPTQGEPGSTPILKKSTNKGHPYSHVSRHSKLSPQRRCDCWCASSPQPDGDDSIRPGKLRTSLGTTRSRQILQDERLRKAIADLGITGACCGVLQPSDMVVEMKDY